MYCEDAYLAGTSPRCDAHFLMFCYDDRVNVQEMVK